MLNHIFNIMRDIRREYTETNVTENRTGKVLYLPVDSMVNVRVDTDGFTEGVSLAIKFEEVSDKPGAAFREIGTFPIPDEAHGILFVKNTDRLRYTLLVDGESPDLNVTLRF
ncbi:hypothetical protein [Mesobacillus zeae]|uniref:hypothetical protein n=1 Tax=Mesobacillus zeae TaxID=1917180 RepID=UPI003008CFFC